MASITSLPDDVLCRVLAHLSHPQDLAAMECTCTWTRTCAKRGGTWKEMAHKGGGAQLASLCRDHGEAKRLVRCLFRAKDAQLAAEVIRSSSVDRPEEDARHVLRPRAAHRRENRRFRHPLYWSSSGTQPEHAMSEDHGEATGARRSEEDVEGKRSLEWIEMRLNASVAVVEAVQMQAFRAEFQRYAPLYAPKWARLVRLKDLQDVDGHGFAEGSDRWEAWEDDVGWHEVEYTDQVQTWSTPRREACIGGCVRLEMRGKPQRQEADGLHYTCLSRVRLLGRAVRGVRVVKEEDGWKLDFDALDETIGKGEDGQDEQHPQGRTAWWEETESTNKWEGWRSDQDTDSEDEEVQVNDWLLQALLVRHMQTERD